jgi:hypothetical protein
MRAAVVDAVGCPPAPAGVDEPARGDGTEGRLVNIGQSAGTDVQLPLEVVRNRQGAGRLTVERKLVPIEEVSAAWQRQAASPGRKLVIAVGRGV